MSTQTHDDSLRVSADTLTAFVIAIIQDTHNAVYDQMCTYYQIAHNQATVETLHKAQQLMNSHYNIALLTKTEQTIDAATDTKLKSTADITQTNTDNTQLKALVASQVSHSLPPTENTDNSNKSSITGRVLPIQ